MKKFGYFLRKLFFPSFENNYRAKVLHHDFLAVYLLLALSLFFTLKYTPIKQNVLGYATDITNAKLLEFTNRKRLAHGLTPLSYNEKLSKAALKKAQDMFSKNYWSHYSPEGSTPWEFIYGAGYNYEYAGENLARNFLFSKSVVDAWMNSETHKENVLRPEFSEVGFSIVNGVLNGEETTLVVQMFASPSKDVTTNIPEGKVKPKMAGIQFENNGMVSGSITDKQKGPSVPILFLAFVAFITSIVFVDYYIASKIGIIRYHGKNLAHLIFLTFILVGFVVFFARGSIL